MERVFITGCAGFIGMHLCKRLLELGHAVYGIDNLNSYYSRDLKNDRVSELLGFKNFEFQVVDISDYDNLKKTMEKFSPDKVVNLAGQAGVRYSLVNPHSYIRSNVNGFLNILECCRSLKIKGLTYASSSSVYGKNSENSFSIKHRVNKPLSLYAATKISNELMAYSYNNLFNLKSTGLRYFTVYGPWGRPDMVMHIFIQKILKNKKIPLFNSGNMYRSFTYIDDAIDGTISAIEKNYDLAIFNIGNNKETKLTDLVSLIEKALSQKAKIDYLSIQPGDVTRSFPDIDISEKKLGFVPKISIKEGLIHFIKWYKDYYTS